MTTGIYNTNYNDYYNQYNLQNTGIQNNNQNVSFTSKQDTELAQELAKKKKKIEKDDGSIGFGKAALNFAKGVGKFFTGMFTDEKGNFSIGQTLKTAAIAVGVGAVTVLTAGTAVPAMIAAAGIGVSAIGMGKSIYDIATADTDAEAEAAWQSLGSNTTAGALAVAGAKAVAKGSAANPSEFDGIGGYAKATKQVFQDSGKAVSESFNGFKTAYKGAGEGITTKLGALKEEGIAQKNSFTGKVTENYNKAVYGTKGKIENEASKLDKEIADKQKQAKDIKDKKSPEYTKIQEEISTLKVKKAAIEKMNETTSWEEGNDIITKQNADLAQKKAELSKATKKADKTKLSKEINELETQIKAGNEVLARRTREAQYIQDQINSKQKTIDSINKQDKPDTAKIAKLNKEIEELKGRQDFELPKDARKENVERLNKDATEQVNNVKTAKENLETAKKELEATDKNDTQAYAAAQRKVKYAEQTLKNEEIAKGWIDKASEYNNAKYNAQEGTGYDHVAREIGTIAYENPAARWLTVGIAGRQFGNKSEYADLYSQLTAQEKAYFKSLPEEQKATILAQYNQIVA